MPTPISKIREHQRLWASARGVAIDSSDRAASLNDNLLAPLSAASRAEFESGDGAELGADGHPGKMQSLISSSALAVNVFEYWRTRDASPLVGALDLPADLVAGEQSVCFEQKFPTGLRGKSPNLDVVLRLQNGSIVAIESKFTEPYTTQEHAGFRDAYFERDATYWADLGLGKCQSLASSLWSGETRFRWLDAAQLLKHILGLAHTTTPSSADSGVVTDGGGEGDSGTTGRGFSLYYLRFQAPDPEGAEHGEEARRFAELIRGDGFRFVTMSYQALFARLEERCGAEDGDYLEYLRQRYFRDLQVPD